ncbi:hypothetical protein [Actinoplanes sp. NPDC020271]
MCAKPASRSHPHRPCGDAFEAVYTDLAGRIDRIAPAAHPS